VETTLYPTCTYGKFTYHDGTTANVAVSASKLQLPTEKHIIQIDLYTVANVLLYTFECLEGNGYQLTDSTGAKTIDTVTSTGKWTGWQDVECSYSWQPKISLAKTILGNAIEMVLSDRGIVVDEANGDVLLDTVANPSIFRIAHDCLSLHLIFNDVMNSGGAEIYQRKSEYYWQRYQDELASGLKRMNLDSTLSGTTTEYRVNFSGRVNR
jgi:hypothetical protein